LTFTLFPSKEWFTPLPVAQRVVAADAGHVPTLDAR
jgi:hypothetical protein